MATDRLVTDEDRECDSCGEMKPSAGGESVLVHTHRVEGRAVGQDWEWVCAECTAEHILAEEQRAEDRAEARQDYYDLK